MVKEMNDEQMTQLLEALTKLSDEVTHLENEVKILKETKYTRNEDVAKTSITNSDGLPEMIALLTEFAKAIKE
jgi:hypothetical protein